MKKRIGIVLVLVVALLVTGCESKTNSGGSKKGGILNNNKTMTCTYEETDSNGYKTSEKMVITYNSKKVIKVFQTTTTEMDAMVTDFAISAGNDVAKAFDNVDGITLKYSQVSTNTVKAEMEVVFDELKEEQIKQVIVDLYGENADTDNLFDQKEISIEDFKKENLEGYTCTD